MEGRREKIGELLIGEFIINVNCITIYLLLLELIFILIAIVIDPIL